MKPKSERATDMKCPIVRRTSREIRLDFCMLHALPVIWCAGPIAQHRCEPEKIHRRPLRILPCACCDAPSSVEVDPEAYPGLYGPFCGRGHCMCEARIDIARDVVCPPVSFRRIVELRPKAYTLKSLQNEREKKP